MDEYWLYAKLAAWTKKSRIFERHRKKPGAEYYLVLKNNIMKKNKGRDSKKGAETKQYNEPIFQR
jgi:hypothetical protein